MRYFTSPSTGREFLVARADTDGAWHVAHDLAVGEVADVVKAVEWLEAETLEPETVDLTVSGQALRVSALRLRGRA